MSSVIASQAKGPNLPDLPHELFLSIVNFTGPGSLLDIACTCKALLRSSQEVLTRHKEAREKYRRCSDETQPLFPTLYRNVARDPISAWHLRFFDSWGTRNLVVEDSLREREIRKCMTVFEDDFQFSEDELEDVRKDLQEGGLDSPLKLATYAKCPRLTELRFLHIETNGVDETEDRDKSLTYLCTLSRSILRGNSIWPVGLQSLRKVAIGVSTPQYGNTAYTRSPMLLAAILKLPTLESVYFRGMELPEDDDWQTDKWDGIFGEGSNNIKEFYLDDPAEESFDLLHGLFGSFKQLESFAIRGGGLLRNRAQFDDCDVIVQRLKQLNRHSLEKIAFYNTDNFHGYRCTMYRPEEFSGYENLKLLVVDASDVLLDAFYNEPDGARTDTTGHIFASNHAFFLEWIEDAFPRSMEVLVLQCHRPIDEPDADFIDDGLVALFKSGNYENLKAVYLDGVESAIKESTIVTKCWFQKAMTIGIEYGIDVHTKTTQRITLHEIDFPMAADAEEEMNSFPNGSTFNPYSGHWEAAGCGNCGSCATCYKIYSPSLWKDARRAMKA